MQQGAVQADDVVTTAGQQKCSWILVKDYLCLAHSSRHTAAFKGSSVRVSGDLTSASQDWAVQQKMVSVFLKTRRHTCEHGRMSATNKLHNGGAQSGKIRFSPIIIFVEEACRPCRDGQMDTDRLAYVEGDIDSQKSNVEL